MKKDFRNRLTDFLIIIINVSFVLALFFGEFFYIKNANARTRESNRQTFINTNVSLGSMTNNYLIGESHLCRSWAYYLNNESKAGRTKTMDEAIDFISESIIDNTVMAHIIYKNGDNSLKGYSTKARKDTNDNAVDYTSLKEVFASASEGMNISSSFMNPINISKSLAFYTEVKLVDPNDNTKQVDAYLLRVVLLNNLREEWTFPSGSFDRLEVAIVDRDGKYILSGNSFANESFYEYYKSYNATTSSGVEEFKNKIRTGSGYLTMNDYSHEKCFIAYSQLNSIEDWTILTYIPLSDINDVHNDWLVIAIIGFGLAALFIFDLVVLLFLNKNLKSTAKIADNANKAKTDFLSTMSHDIRTPMNAIVGLTTIARQDPTNSPATQDALNKIELASNHLLTLINDILDISKVESGKLAFNPLTFSITETFENLINISQPMIRSKHIDFAFYKHDIKYEWLYADKLRLSQIFTNILSNALKYTNENGKVQVDIKELDSEKEGYTKLVYIVKDNGIGMSPEFLQKLYEPFSRATDSRVNSIQGTGLGLAIVKQMVTLMKGDIECQSELGVGTTFTVTLDLQIAEKPQEEVSSNEENLDFSHINVLVTEDNDINWEIISTLLEMNGIKSERATNGKEALELMEDENSKGRFDLIFMDIQMPVMNGLDATREIRKFNKDIPIIAMTADAFSENVTECLEAGMNGHIAKPIDMKLVLAEIRKIKK